LSFFLLIYKLFQTKAVKLICQVTLFY